MLGCDFLIRALLQIILRAFTYARFINSQQELRYSRRHGARATSHFWRTQHAPKRGTIDIRHSRYGGLCLRYSLRYALILEVDCRKLPSCYRRRYDSGDYFTAPLSA